MSFGLVRQVGPWSETKQDTRFQSYDAHRNYRVDPMLQGAPAPPVKPSVYAERSIIDKRPFMPFRRVNNLRVAVNPYATKPSLGDSYAGEMGAGGRTLGAAPSKDLDRLNPINHPQVKYEGDLSREEDGFPGVETPSYVTDVPRRVLEVVNTAVARAGGEVIRNAPMMIDLVNSALNFVGNNAAIEGLVHTVATPQAAQILSEAVEYQQGLRRLIQNTVINPGGRALGDTISRTLFSASPDMNYDAYTPTPMVQEYLDSVARTNQNRVNSFVQLVVALLQIASLNQAVRQRAVGRVRSEVLRINNIAANTGRGVVGGVVRSYRNV